VKGFIIIYHFISELSILSPLLGNNATLDVTATTTLDTTAATDVELSADNKISSDSQHKKQKSK